MIPRDYFIVMYVALFLMAPYINLMLDSLTEKKFKLMLLVLFLLFPVWNSGIQVVEEIVGVSMPNASTVSQSGNLGGRSIVNFVMCYILGTAIRKKYISFKKPVIVLLACAACNLLLYALGFGVSMNYMSPVTLVEAMAFVMLAEKLKLQSRIVNFIAKASLTVYIVHVPMVVSHIDYIDFVGKPFINMLAEYAAIVLAAYGVGVVMYYAYSYLTATFRKKIGAKLSKIEISV